MFDSELMLLRTHGHDVETLVLDNALISDQRSPVDAVRLGVGTVWSREGHQSVANTLKRFPAEAVHFHNTFPRISPAAHYAAHAAGATVVQTLHNYRLLCANGMLLRDERPCEDCVGTRLALPALRHRCYRSSGAATAAVVAMQVVHRALGTWTRTVDHFIALTDFARRKFIEAGLPADRIAVEPNFVHPDPGLGQGDGNYALFVGRLSSEKGIETLLDAWRRVRSLRLVIIGDGPLADKVRSAAEANRQIEWRGKLPSHSVLSAMRQARVLLIPSAWYEGLPRVLVEAYAVGLPVIASNLGALSAAVVPGRTGAHVPPQDSVAIAREVERISASELAHLRDGARKEFEEKYAAPRHLEALLKLYRSPRKRTNHPNA